MHRVQIWKNICTMDVTASQMAQINCSAVMVNQLTKLIKRVKHFKLVTDVSESTMAMKNALILGDTNIRYFLNIFKVFFFNFLSRIN